MFKYKSFFPYFLIFPKMPKNNNFSQKPNLIEGNNKDIINYTNNNILHDTIKSVENNYKHYKHYKLNKQVLISENDAISVTVTNSSDINGYNKYIILLLFAAVIYIKNRK